MPHPVEDPQEAPSIGPAGPGRSPGCLPEACLMETRRAAVKPLLRRDRKNGVALRPASSQVARGETAGYPWRRRAQGGGSSSVRARVCEDQVRLRIGWAIARLGKSAHVQVYGGSAVRGELVYMCVVARSTTRRQPCVCGGMPGQQQSSLPCTPRRHPHLRPRPAARPPDHPPARRAAAGRSAARRPPEVLGGVVRMVGQNWGLGV